MPGSAAVHPPKTSSQTATSNIGDFITTTPRFFAAKGAK